MKVPSAVQDIFRQYTDAVRDCLVVSERCYLKGVARPKVGGAERRKTGALELRLATAAP